MNNLYRENFDDITSISNAKYYNKEPENFQDIFLNSSLIKNKDNPNEISPVKGPLIEYTHFTETKDIFTAKGTLQKLNITPKQFLENANLILGIDDYNK